MEDFVGYNSGTREKEEVYSKAIRAGKRTYFVDVKETKSGERYITITESKRHFDEQTSKFVYEKHKIFLYKEDFDKFVNGLDCAISFIKTGVAPEEEKPESVENAISLTTDIEFDSLS